MGNCCIVGIGSRDTRGGVENLYSMEHVLVCNGRGDGEGKSGGVYVCVHMEL